MLCESEDFDIILMGSERIHLFDTPLLVSRNMGLAVDQRAAKRVMDILISGIGIIITSPIMLIIAIAVKAYDRGPVFYFQDRLTLGGKPFKICKFRSMCVDSEKKVQDWHPSMIPYHTGRSCAEKSSSG